MASSIFTAAAEVCARVPGLDLDTAIQILQQLEGDTEAAISFLQNDSTSSPTAKRPRHDSNADSEQPSDPSNQEDDSDDIVVMDSPPSLKVLTWNIDGLCDSPVKLLARMGYVLEDIKAANPDVIMFQELTLVTVARIHPMLTRLGFKHPRFAESPLKRPYFTGFYSRYPLNVVDRYAFEGEARSNMFRDLFICSVTVAGWPLFHLAVGHLDSGKEVTDTRVAQGKAVLQQMGGYEYVIFGGDTNLRVKEHAQLKPLMTSNDVEDAFEAVGQPKAVKFTWDTSINDNLGFTGPRCRFDQLWLRNMSCSDMELVGTTRRHQGFPSDHFGLMVQVAKPGSDE
jgi:exonuclease III